MIGELPELLDARLGEGVASVEVIEETIDFGDLAGPEHTADRTLFAELLAGTSDKKSRAYKAQRRNIERWVKGRKPVVVSRRRIVSARRQQSHRIARFRRHGALMRLRVLWYGGADGRKPEWLPPHRWIRIPREVIRRVIRLWATRDADDLRDAAVLLLREFLERYDVPNPDDWERDAEIIDLLLEPDDA